MIKLIIGCIFIIGLAGCSTTEDLITQMEREMGVQTTNDAVIENVYTK